MSSLKQLKHPRTPADAQRVLKAITRDLNRAIAIGVLLTLVIEGFRVYGFWAHLTLTEFRWTVALTSLVPMHIAVFLYYFCLGGINNIFPGFRYAKPDEQVNALLHTDELWVWHEYCVARTWGNIGIPFLVALFLSLTADMFHF